MRIFILALGTRGDVEPFVALGHVLRRRGHHVTIGSSGFHMRADPFLDWVQIGTGSKAGLTALLASMADGTAPGERAGVFRDRWITPQVASGVDAIVGHAASHDYCITNLHMPMQRDGKVYPAAQVLYDLPQDADTLALANSQPDEPRIVKIVALHQALVDPEKAWGAQYRFSGFWKLAAWNGSPAPALAAFLAAGSAPVVLTMGSMVTFDAFRLATIFRAALALCGMRGVLVTGWSSLPENGPGLQDDPSLMVVTEADYASLFARAGCVVHHGGSGTLASVLRAGVPSILLPQLGTQQAWGSLLHSTQLCADVLATDTLYAPLLADAMRRARDDAPLRARCREWAGKIAHDDGAELAARMIESHWTSL